MEDSFEGIVADGSGLSWYCGPLSTPLNYSLFEHVTLCDSCNRALLPKREEMMNIVLL